MDTWRQLWSSKRPGCPTDYGKYRYKVLGWCHPRLLRQRGNARPPRENHRGSVLGGKTVCDRNTIDEDANREMGTAEAYLVRLLICRAAADVEHLLTGSS
jgi:hypothetical protein